MARGDDRTEEAPARVPVGKRLRQLLSQLGPARLIGTLLFLLVAVLIARLGWQFPLTREAECAPYASRATAMRSAERRVGKESVRHCRYRWSPYTEKKHMYTYHQISYQ